MISLTTTRNLFVQDDFGLLAIVVITIIAFVITGSAQTQIATEEAAKNLSTENTSSTSRSAGRAAPVQAQPVPAALETSEAVVENKPYVLLNPTLSSEQL